MPKKNKVLLFDFPRLSGEDRQRIEESVYRLSGNTGNVLYVEACKRQFHIDEMFSDIEQIPSEPSTVVMSMGNWISNASDLSHHLPFVESNQVDRIVMLGAGTQADDFDRDITLAPSVSRFLSIVAEKATTIGVRGEFTADYLVRLGIKNVTVVGCPSVYLYSGTDERPVDRTPRIAIHTSWQGIFRDKIADLLWFGVRHDASLVEQSVPTLLQFAEDKILNDDVYFASRYYSHSLSNAWEVLDYMRRRMVYFTDMDEWIRHLEGVDFAVGSRFHGSVAALLAGKRVLPLALDARMVELLEHFGLPYMSIEEFDREAPVEKLMDLASLKRFQSSFPARKAEFAEFLRMNGLDPLPSFEPKDAVAAPETTPLRLAPVFRSKQKGQEVERLESLAPPETWGWNRERGLSEHYQTNRNLHLSDDRPPKDEWQEEVYLIARKLARLTRAKTICDFGCGSARMLLTHLAEYDTIGYEAGVAFEDLKEQYPERDWREARNVNPSMFDADIVICSDIIEQLEEPHVLLSALGHSKAKIIVLSTPAREILSERGMSPPNGPPIDRHHACEWSTREFGELAARHLKVESHFVIHVDQATQVCICRRQGDHATAPLPSIWE